MSTEPSLTSTSPRTADVPVGPRPAVAPAVADVLGDDHVTRQADLAVRYQAALRRADGDRTAVDADGREALDALVADITPLLYKILRDKVRSRFPHQPPEGLAEECYAEMVAAVIDAAARFDPARCPAFHSWVTGEQGEARAALSACLNFATGHDSIEPRVLRALKIAAQAEMTLEAQLGRTPSTTELQQAMLDYCYSYQYDRLDVAQQQLPEEEWHKLVHAKLRNNSMLANIEKIETLRQRAARTISPDEVAGGWDYLNAHDHDLTAAAADTGLDEAQTSRDMRDLFDAALFGMSLRDKQIVAARLAGTDARSSSLTAVAERFRVTVAEVKDKVAVATSRLTAAHAHYAFLAPGIDAQFEEAPTPATSGMGALLSGIAPALV